jgi:hypothetical protein
MNTEKKTKFYTYRQYNSLCNYYYFEEEKGITKYVIIEAFDHIHANARAEDIGIYFDGSDNGEDCSCCGDRWFRAEDEHGKDVPSIFGKPLRDIEEFRFNEFCFVHYLDGKIEKIAL